MYSNKIRGILIHLCPYVCMSICVYVHMCASMVSITFNGVLNDDIHYQFPLPQNSQMNYAITAL